ncbi:MAG: hypothetical protein OXU66_00460 [Gammaproteobacteria bacterium]|nr:hypothetical protein [Gammaproteobacteria bacterium]MDD9894711.1 hypothetical protein [Gammaproteobacteria bacterium]MDD9957385.1 hypothetical protein [Gammaproteobacteria bacterium]
MFLNPGLKRRSSPIRFVRPQLQYLLANPADRIRIENTIYPVTMRRLFQDAELDLSWRARSAKLGNEPGTPRPDDWWSFEMISM